MSCCIIFAVIIVRFAAIHATITASEVIHAAECTDESQIDRTAVETVEIHVLSSGDVFEQPAQVIELDFLDDFQREGAIGMFDDTATERVEVLAGNLPDRFGLGIVGELVLMIAPVFYHVLGFPDAKSSRLAHHLDRIDKATGSDKFLPLAGFGLLAGDLGIITNTSVIQHVSLLV